MTRRSVSPVLAWKPERIKGVQVDINSRRVYSNELIKPLNLQHDYKEQLRSHIETETGVLYAVPLNYCHPTFTSLTGRLPVFREHVCWPLCTVADTKAIKVRNRV